MLGYFPTPYPDELLYSLIARYHEHSANRGYKSTLMDLYGSTMPCAVVDLPSHLGRLAEHLPAINQVTAEDLLQETTLFPYYCAFSTKGVRARVRADMLGEEGGRIHTRLGIAAFRVKCPAMLRICPKCYTEELAQHGEPYWHRAQQLPGVVVCPMHHAFLQATNARYHPYGKHDYISAAEAMIADPSGIAAAPRVEALSEEVAQRSIALLNAHEFPATELTSYREQVLARGYCRGALVDIVALEQAFHGLFPPDMLELWGVQHPSDDEASWLRAAVRKPRKQFHPFIHILMQRFLQERAEIGDSPARRNSSSGRHTPSDIVRFRNEWSSLMKAHAGDGKSWLRKQHPALYAWLYRHDRQWLLDQSIEIRHTPRTSNIDWCDRQNQLLAEAKLTIARIRSATPPIRVTPTSVLRSLGVESMARANRGSLQGLWEYLEVASESTVDFQLRRLDYVAGTLMREDGRLRLWSLVRRAGLRPPLGDAVGKHVQELIKAYG